MQVTYRVVLGPARGWGSGPGNGPGTGPAPVAAGPVGDLYAALTGPPGGATLSRVSTEQKSVPETDTVAREPDGPRPARLTAAAALCALEGCALAAGGVWMLVLGATGDSGDRQQGVTGGVTLLVLALLPLLAARGLLMRRGWSRGPAVITQIMALPVAYSLLQADSVAIPAGIVLAVVAIAALVLLVNQATTRALGIKGPGRAEPK